MDGLPADHQILKQRDQVTEVVERSIRIIFYVIGLVSFLVYLKLLKYDYELVSLVLRTCITLPVIVLLHLNRNFEVGFSRRSKFYLQLMLIGGIPYFFAEFYKLFPEGYLIAGKMFLLFLFFQGVFYSTFLFINPLRREFSTELGNTAMYSVMLFTFYWLRSSGYVSTFLACVCLFLLGRLTLSLIVTRRYVLKSTQLIWFGHLSIILYTLLVLFLGRNPNWVIQDNYLVGALLILNTLFYLYGAIYRHLFEEPDERIMRELDERITPRQNNK